MHEQKILAVLKELQKNVEELLRLNRLMHTFEKGELKGQQVTEMTAPSAPPDAKQQMLPEESKVEDKEIPGREKPKGVHR